MYARDFNQQIFEFFSQKKSMYMDVWPMNLFGGQYSDEFDTSSLFQLQLACILNMVIHSLRDTKNAKVIFKKNSLGSRLEGSRAPVFHIILCYIILYIILLDILYIILQCFPTAYA